MTEAFLAWSPVQRPDASLFCPSLCCTEHCPDLSAPNRGIGKIITNSQLLWHDLPVGLLYRVSEQTSGQLSFRPRH